MPWRGVTFTERGSAILFQPESAIVLGAARGLSIFEANVWGMLFYVAQIHEDHNGTLGIHLHQFVGYVLLFVQHAGNMFQTLGYSGPIHVEISLTSLLSTQWLRPEPRGMWFSPSPGRPGSQLDDQITFSLSTTSEALRDKPDGVAMDVLRIVFFSVNWPELVDKQQKLEELVIRGYEFNLWLGRDKLRI